MMFGKIKGVKYNCGIDIGSQRIKVSVVKTKGDQGHELLGVFDAQCAGLSNSSISDLTELSECIHLAVSGLIKKTGIKVRDLQLGVGGNFILAKRCQAVIPLLDKGSKVIAYSDIRKINHQARLLGVKMEEEVLHDFPQHYRVDDMNHCLNPSGLYGRKLEVEMLLLSANNSCINNIVKGVNQAGYEISNLFFSTYAAGEAVLNKKYKTDGCVLVDIGSSVTDILVFKDGLLRYAEIIPVGGDHVTRSIAHTLNLSFDISESVKKSYAIVRAADVKDDEEILIKKEENYVSIRRETICRAIEPEIEKLVAAIDEVIRNSKLNDRLNMGILMVGGGALLPGLIERIEHRTNLPVGMGKINIDTAKIAPAAHYAAAVGLAQMGLVKSADPMHMAGSQGNWMANVSNKVKEAYQEYF